MLSLGVTDQVTVGEGTGSCGATKRYTTLVIHTIIQTRFPVLQRASQCRKVFYTFSFSITANGAKQLISKSLYRKIRNNLKNNGLFALDMCCDAAGGLDPKTGKWPH